MQDSMHGLEVSTRHMSIAVVSSPSRGVFLSRLILQIGMITLHFAILFWDFHSVLAVLSSVDYLDLD